MTDTCVITGSLVVIGHTGVLITGRPGAGKSMAVVELALRGCGIVCDELVRIHRSPGNSIVGESFAMPPKIEIRGLGVFIIADIFPEALQGNAEISLVVELKEFDPARDLGRITPEVDQIDLLGIAIPRYRVSVTCGASASSLIQTIVRFYARSGKTSL